MQTNKVKPFFNTLLKTFGIRKPKPYTLLSKELNLPANSYRVQTNTIYFNKAVTADKVVIAKTGNHRQQKIITTFKDKTGQIVERCFEYIGIDSPETHRVYTKLNSVFEGSISGKLIQTFENLNKEGNVKIWAKVSSEKQFVHKDYISGKKDCVTIAKVSTKERDINPPVIETHSITEYPAPCANSYFFTNKKSLVFTTTRDLSGIPQITDIKASNVEIPKNDKYLALRMYDFNDVKKPAASIALKKAKLDDVGIYIQDSYYMKNTTKGSFNHINGIISFNYIEQPKLSIIGTAFHEVEHAKQYELMGRTKLFDTIYTKNCLKKHGEKTSPEDLKRAKAYYEAHDSYVPSSVNYDEYRENLLEREARKAADNAVDEYIEQGKELIFQFWKVFREEL